jgi:hypothetical protein
LVTEDRVREKSCCSFVRRNRGRKRWGRKSELEEEEGFFELSVETGRIEDCVETPCTLEGDLGGNRRVIAVISDHRSGCSLAKFEGKSSEESRSYREEVKRQEDLSVKEGRASLRHCAQKDSAREGRS